MIYYLKCCQNLLLDEMYVDKFNINLDILWIMRLILIFVKQLAFLYENIINEPILTSNP